MYLLPVVPWKNTREAGILAKAQHFKFPGVFSQSVSFTKWHLFHYFCDYFEWGVSVIVEISCFWFDPFIPSSRGCPAYQENQETWKMSGKWRKLPKNHGKLSIIDRISWWSGKYQENLLFQKLDIICFTNWLSQIDHAEKFYHA